jgi:predicted metal-dependent HD superfamily phosphohydrolase
MNSLARSWSSAWPLLTGGDVGVALRDTLLARYEETHRCYHTLQHLRECVAHFAAVRQLAEHPAEVEIALWFHDAIYDVRNKDNERLSAAWAKRALLEAGVNADAAERVSALILATQHAVLPESPDAQLLVDIDLSILGAARARFESYDEQIRHEYSWVAEPVYRSKRLAVLQGFLDRAFIYSTPHFRETLEEAARENLRTAVGALGAGR